MKLINQLYCSVILSSALLTQMAFAVDAECDTAFKNSSANNSCWYNGYYTTRNNDSCNYVVDCPSNPKPIDINYGGTKVSAERIENKITVPLLQAACLKNLDGVLKVNCN